MKKVLYPLGLLLAALLFFNACAARRMARQATTDQGVVINGVRWATRNVDAPGTFAPSPESFGMIYQWGSRIGWNATGNVTNWSHSWTQLWAWDNSNDPCPEGWRLPTSDELQSLIVSGSIATTINGVNGRLFGTAPNQLFLPAAGWRCDQYGVLSGAGSYGDYWSGQLDRDRAFSMGLTRDRAFIGRSIPARGFSVRCVAIQ